MYCQNCECEDCSDERKLKEKAAMAEKLAAVLQNFFNPLGQRTARDYSERAKVLREWKRIN